MKIACISDTHGQHWDLQMSKYPADMLIHAGDFTRGRDFGLSETQNFLSWLSEQPYKYKIFIAGNHEQQIEAGKELFNDLLLQYPDIIYLNNSDVTINGIKFYGSPYSNRFGAWAFMDDEIALVKIWAEIPDDTAVLVTHGPAYGTNDLVNNLWGPEPHVGSKSLTKRKQELAGTLKAHINGHIHEAYGTTGTNPINICASVLDEKYQLVNNPIVLEI